MVFSIHYRNKGASLVVSDEDNYVIIKKLFDSLFNHTFSIKFKYTYRGIFFHTVAYTKHEVLWILELVVK
jgi:hypothetical protein